MAELTLHFEASQGTDLEAASAALDEQLKSVSGVESVETTPQRFQAIGPAEIMSIMTVGTQMVEHATTFLAAVAGLYAAYQKIKPMFPGLHAPTVEVGLKQIPIDQLTEAHRAELAAS